LILLIKPIDSIQFNDWSYMNLKQLKVFLAVADSGSFSKGAEASCITQSTVSQHIASLESEFGVRLLDRTAKGALLTEGGKVLLQHARGLMAEMHAVEQVMRRFKGIEEAELTVGCSNIPGVYMIPSALQRLQHCFPGLTITLSQSDSREVLAKLVRNEMEIGVVGGVFEEEGFEFQPLNIDTIRLIVSGTHPWAKQKNVTWDELLTVPFVFREPGSGTGTAVCSALESVGIQLRQLKISAYLGSNEAVKLAVSGGLGIAFVSELSVAKEVRRRELAFVDVEGLIISRRFFLVNRVGRELSPAAKAFTGEKCSEERRNSDNKFLHVTKEIHTSTAQETNPEAPSEVQTPPTTPLAHFPH
jgi:DNA-binding transcriptional LysR family regulator